jgi:hypothetical protein
MKEQYDSEMATMDPAQAEQIKMMQKQMADPAMQQQMAGVSAMMNVRVAPVEGGWAQKPDEEAEGGCSRYWCWHQSWRGGE